jgi:hypothetical protein
LFFSLALLAGVVSQSAGAQDTAGAGTSYPFGDLAASCAAPAGSYDQGICDGFILGSGSLYLQLRRAEVVDAWACADPVPDIATLRQVVAEWAAGHPGAADERAVDGLWRALSDVYPCDSED